MEIESSELRSCTGCLVGQGRGCRCADTDPIPSARSFALLAVALVAGALVFGIGLGQLITWATL